MYIQFGIISDFKITYIPSTQNMYLSRHPSRRHCYSQDTVIAKENFFKILFEIALQSVWAQRDKAVCFPVSDQSGTLQLDYPLHSSGLELSTFSLFSKIIQRKDCITLKGSTKNKQHVHRQFKEVVSQSLSGVWLSTGLGSVFIAQENSLKDFMSTWLFFFFFFLSQTQYFILIVMHVIYFCYHFSI